MGYRTRCLFDSDSFNEATDGQRPNRRSKQTRVDVIRQSHNVPNIVDRDCLMVQKVQEHCPLSGANVWLSPNQKHEVGGIASIATFAQTSAASDALNVKIKSPLGSGWHHLAPEGGSISPDNRRAAVTRACWSSTDRPSVFC